MIKFADKSMLPHLITLWQKSFGDSVEYIQMFLDWNFERIKTIVYVTDEETARPVSVAYLLPIRYIEKGQANTPCWYLYAAATLPEYRGRGYFAEILQFADENMSEPVILVPGEKSLISYYEKQGLHMWLSERKKEVTVPDAGREVNLQNLVIADVPVARYIKRRAECLVEMNDGRKGVILWNELFMEYICHENQFCGGKIKQIRIEDMQYITMYRVENKQLKLLELLPQTNVQQVTEALLECEKCDRADVVLQPPVMATKKFKPEKENGYFNLIMG